jgi:hypothetical protein
MAKPKAVTLAVRTLKEATIVHLRTGGVYEVAMDAPVPEPGRYVVIPEEDAEALAKKLTDADARTRLDKSARKPRKRARAKARAR